MTKTLNHDVLKRTTGFLSDIDMVLAAPNIAGAVERVLSSAAPSLNRYTYPTLDDWEADLVGDEADLDQNECGCDENWVTFLDDDGDLDKAYLLDCDDIKDDPIIFNRAPWMLNDGSHAAKDPCGVPECACTAVFPEPEENE